MRDALGIPQSILVLGGTSDLALATVAELSGPREPKVVLAVRDEVRGAEAAGAIGAHAVTVPFDAAAVETHPRFVEELFAAHGDFDVVLVAFGLLDADDPLEVVDVNYRGAVSVLVALAERLKRQGHGAIVVFSSVAAERPRRANYLYGSTKAGLDAFAQGLHDDLAGTGVHVLTVRPGFVHTKMTEGRDPAPFSTTPDVVARAVADGLRRGAHTVWAPRGLRVLMTVLRHLPRPLFRRLPG
jgi:decaprenylphospho-beta-D-erythro-pentofuranosid-2-ulose 2-reductase